MTESLLSGPNLLITNGLQILLDKRGSEVNTLPDLLKTLKDFQEESNNALTELISQTKDLDTDKCENDDDDDENFKQEQKKMKLVHT